MASLISHNARWDSLVSAFESDLLSASDDEVLALVGSDKLDRVDSALGISAKWDDGRLSSAFAQSCVTTPKKASANIGAAWLDRIQLMQQLLMSRPELRPRLVAVFGDKKDSSIVNPEIAAIARELDQAEKELKRLK